MIDTTILLTTHARVQDDNGVWRDGSAISREVFAQVDSVSRDEFFQGGRNGLRPEYRFTIFWGEWQGERECTYMGVDYSIYRSYHIPGTDYLELYAERKAGVNNGAKNPC